MGALAGGLARRDRRRRRGRRRCATATARASSPRSSATTRPSTTGSTPPSTRRSSATASPAGSTASTPSTRPSSGCRTGRAAGCSARGGVLSGDSVHTVRYRARIADPDAAPLMRAVARRPRRRRRSPRAAAPTCTPSRPSRLPSSTDPRRRRPHQPERTRHHRGARDRRRRPTTTEVPVDDRRSGDGPSTSSGDSLFPELGSADLDVQSYDVRLSYDPDDRAARRHGRRSRRRCVAAARRDRPRRRRPRRRGGRPSTAQPATFEHDAPELLVRPATPVGPGAPVVVVGHLPRRPPRQRARRSGSAAASTRRRTGRTRSTSPTAARTWLPSNDHPSDKATWRFELTVPAGVTAVANGELVEQRAGRRRRRRGSGSRTSRWRRTSCRCSSATYAVLDGGAAGDGPADQRGVHRRRRAGCSRTST